MEILAVVLGFAALILAVVALDRAGAAGRRARALEDELRRLRGALAEALQTRELERPVATEGVPAGDDGVLDADEPRVTEDDEAAAPGPVIEPPRGVEAAIGLTWATRVGGALLLAGIIFFFKYAVDRDWLGPWARVGVGVAVGVGALALSAWLRGRASRTWVDVLAGVGLAILLVVAWASHALYGLVPPVAAFAAFLALVVAGGALAVVWDSEPLVVTATLAALANPILLGDAVGDEGLRFAYVDVIAAAVLVVATPRRWAVAAFAAALGGLLVAAAWWLDRGGAIPAQAPWVTLLSVVALGGIIAGAALRWRDATLRSALLGVGAAVIVTGLTALIPRGSELALAAGCAVTAAGLAAARRVADTGWASLAGLIATTAALGVRGAPSEPAGVALLGLMAALYLGDAALALARREGPVGVAEHLLWQLILAGLAFTGLAIAGLGLPRRGPLAVAAAGMTLAYAGAGTWLLVRGRRVGAAAAFHVALAFLAAIAPLVLSGTGVLVAWVALGTITGALAGRAALPRLELGAVIVLGLALLHVAVVDWPAPLFAREAFYRSEGAAGAFFAPALVGPRVLSLASLGLGALVFGWAGRDASWRRLGVVVRFLGLTAVGLALAAEAALLVERGAVDGPITTIALADQATTALDGVASLRGLATTLALGGWAAMVLIWGFARRDVHARWFGLGLLAVVVLKVLALDLWEMDPVARTITLVAFGVLLLASGFLYARFGARLRRILREDEDKV